MFKNIACSEKICHVQKNLSSSEKIYNKHFMDFRTENEQIYVRIPIHLKLTSPEDNSMINR